MNKDFVPLLDAISGGKMLVVKGNLAELETGRVGELLTAGFFIRDSCRGSF